MLGPVTDTMTRHVSATLELESSVVTAVDGDRPVDVGRVVRMG